MDLDTTVKVAIYRATAEVGRPPSLSRVAKDVGATSDAVQEAYTRLRANRVLLLDLLVPLSGAGG